MGKSLTIEQALAEAETQLLALPKQQMSASATKRLATALQLVRGVGRAYQAQSERLAKQSASKQAATVKPPPAQSVKRPAETTEARRKRLLNSTSVGAQVIRTGDQKGGGKS